MEGWLIGLFSGVIGAIIGGVICAAGSVIAVRAAQRDLEIDELRRQKIGCLINLMGLRYVMSGSEVLLSQQDKSNLMYELNKAIALWSGNPRVCNLLRDVHTGQTVENMVLLFRAMAEDTKLPLDKLSNNDISAAFIKQ